MNLLVTSSLQNLINQFKSYVIEQSSEWAGRIIAHLTLAKTYMQDPRYASGAVFLINFPIIEIATLVSQSVEYLLPKTYPNARYAGRHIVAVSLAAAGNLMFVKWSSITLHPLVVTAIAVLSLTVKYELKKFAE